MQCIVWWNICFKLLNNNNLICYLRVGQEGLDKPRRENRPQDAFLILLFESIFFMRNKKSNILFRILLNSWWAEMDSNHRTLTRTDLQSAAFSHSAICPFSHLKNNKWCTLKDSNLGPTGYEPVALTNWAKGAFLNALRSIQYFWIDVNTFFEKT